MPIIVIGAGLAGLSAAKALTDLGVTGITVLEAAPGPGEGTSYANGALLHPSHPEPWNSPGVGWQLLRDLGHDDAAVLLRLKALPSLIGWGLRFLGESRPAAFRRNTLANLALARYSVGCMPGLRDEGIAYAHAPTGSMMLFRDKEGMRVAEARADFLAGHGLEHETLDVEATIAREPALAPIANQLVGAIYNPRDERGDAHAFCTSLASWLASRGVAFRHGCAVRTLPHESSRIKAVELADGERIDCDALVMAAGPHSPRLLATAGLDAPIRPVKGYSLTLEPASPSTPARPRMPVIDQSLHIVLVPVGDTALRVAGTAEFCGYDLELSPARIDNLRLQMASVYPRLFEDTRAWTQRPWAGLRPMCANGVPLIGATRIEGLYLNTGHGHLGWTQAAGSGRLLADAITGRKPDIDARPYSPGRFGL
jgi:D-amino-acid dehydrogenase